MTTKEVFEQAFIDLIAEDAELALSLLTGMFVGMTVELTRRAGHDTNGPISIDGGNNRDITIHAKKETQSPMKAAILRLDSEFLRSLLQLPDEARVEAVHSPIDEPHLVLIRISGAGFETKEGQLINRATGYMNYERLADGRMLAPKIRWTFDEETDQ